MDQINPVLVVDMIVIARHLMHTRHEGAAALRAAAVTAHLFIRGVNQLKFIDTVERYARDLDTTRRTDFDGVIHDLADEMTNYLGGGRYMYSTIMQDLQIDVRANGVAEVRNVGSDGIPLHEFRIPDTIRTIDGLEDYIDQQFNDGGELDGWRLA